MANLRLLENETQQPKLRLLSAEPSKNWIAEGLKDTVKDITAIPFRALGMRAPAEGAFFSKTPSMGESLVNDILPFLAEKATTPIGKFEIPTVSLTGGPHIEKQDIQPTPLDIAIFGLISKDVGQNVANRFQWNKYLTKGIETEKLRGTILKNLKPLESALSQGGIKLDPNLDPNVKIDIVLSQAKKSPTFGRLVVELNKGQVAPKIPSGVSPIETPGRVVPETPKTPSLRLLQPQTELQPSAGGLPAKMPAQVSKWLEKGVSVVERQAPIKITDPEAKIKDLSGAIVDLPTGHEMTPYKLSNGKIWLHDGKNVVVEAEQLFQLKNRNIVLGEQKPITEEPRSFITSDDYSDVNWKKVNSYLKQKGYDVKGEEDVKNIYSRMTRNFTQEPTGEHLEALNYATTKKVQSEQTKAARYFGYTNNLQKAGYMTPDGKLLDFSGERQGNKGAIDRAMDHREINFVLDYENPELKAMQQGNEHSNSVGMRYFMNKGNIRMQKEGIDLTAKPTDKQLSLIKDHILSNKGGNYFVDISNKEGNTIKSFSYEWPNVKVSSIINDIEKFFKENFSDVSSSVQWPMAGGMAQGRSRTLSGIINSNGGIDLSKDYNVKELKEFGVKNTLGAKQPDEWAKDLVAEGLLNVPSDMNPGDYLVEVLKDPKLNKIATEGPTIKEIKAEKTRIKDEERKTAELEEAKEEFFGSPGITSENPPPTGRGGLVPPELNFGKWKDASTLSLSRETLERNIETISGQDAPKVKKFITEPIKDNETKRVEFVNASKQEVADKIKGWGIKLNSLEDKLIQRYGERRITLEDLKKSTTKWSQVVEASGYFRSQYDILLDRVNGQRASFGYDPIPKRQDYFRHFQEISDAINSFGLILRRNDLPTEISGITNIFKPGKPFSTAELQRKGGPFTESAIGGMDNYLDSISKQIFHIDSVQRARVLEKYIRISGKEGLADLPNFVANLGEFGNLLSGKKALFDRAFESVFGRPIYKVINWIKTRTSANMIAGNISSALTNFIPLTQSLATTNKSKFIKGMVEGLSAPFEQYPNMIDGVKSDFLTRRYPRGPIVLTGTQTASQVASWLFQSIDRFTAKSIVAGKYYEILAKNKGIPKEVAMRLAGNYAGRVITDRSMGQLPNLMGARSLGILTQFQTEINNVYSFVTKDIPRMNEGNRWKIVSAILQFFIYSYIYNNLFEKATGRRPTLDPIYMILTLAGASQRGQGKPLGKRAWAAFSDVKDNLPFAGGITGGRFPISAGIPDVGKLAQGKTTIGKELIKPAAYLLPPFGGGQVKKTIEGLSAVSKGKSTTPTGRLRYRIEQSPANIARGGLFGAYSFPEVNAYYNRNPKAKRRTSKILNQSRKLRLLQ